MDHVTLITGNEGKTREYAALLGIEVSAVKKDLIEIQSLDVVEVVQRKAQDAYQKLETAVLVDDTGLSLDAWNGLPGALVAWWLTAVGPQGILDMAAGVADRAARVTTALGYADANGVRVFEGTVRGTLTTERRGDGGFGYDSIFIPAGYDQTFAEMTAEEKNRVSHRRLAVETLKKGLATSLP